MKIFYSELSFIDTWLQQYQSSSNTLSNVTYKCTGQEHFTHNQFTHKKLESQRKKKGKKG